jgi:hypothetical protein
MLVQEEGMRTAEGSPGGLGRPRTPRRRRPVGEPAPLPRDLRGTAILGALLIVALALIYGLGRLGPRIGELQRAIDRPIRDAFAGPGSGVGGDIGRGLHELLPWAVLIAFRWAVVITLIVFRRWRHLAVLVLSIVIVGIWARRFPMAGVEGSGVPGHPSEAMAGVAVAAMGVVYGIAPPGRLRTTARIAAAVVLVVMGLLILLIERNTFVEVVTAAATGLAVPILGFRILAPESAFPVTYHRGKAAHLDVSGAREEAIRRAMREQLGLVATDVAPFGLAGSGGCTPLRISLADGMTLFGKLYATSHLRADRWYKLGRTIRYGALEDERSFNSVRRMAEYEDYMLRYLRDHGISSAEPVGFVELVPEREYLLLCGFFEDAVEILDADVDDGVIRSGIDLVRRLWDAGLAHRDVKPSNLLVRRGEVVAIDVFFCQVHPSPWRRSVDLANMLLTLALRSDPETVYVVALERFTPAEIAEAFAASRSVTIPSQLRRELARDGRDLPTAFRALAPPRDPIAIQRWTLRRIALTLGLLASTAVFVAFALLNLRPAGFTPP